MLAVECCASCICVEEKGIRVGLVVWGVYMGFYSSLHSFCICFEFLRLSILRGFMGIYWLTALM
jgi:hypothetical protein